ncbi:serine/threonine kinase [Aureococcus anophagefferens]|nr:serine/threonine kinase [Aureococcus anophagefferens]
MTLHRAMAAAWLCVVLVARARADDALARVVAVDRWLDGDGPPPAHWEVASKRDLNPRWKKLAGGNSKQVSKTSYGKAKVVVKTKIEHTKGSETLKRERILRAELLFLEYLAGSPGVPKLYGGWLGDGGARVTYVVQDAGEILGAGTGTVGRPAKPTAPWAAFARNAPVAALRALLECFRSFSEVGGYFLDDFAHQFTVIDPGQAHDDGRRGLPEGHLEPAAKKPARSGGMLAPDPDDRPNLTALLFLDGAS